MLIECPQCHEWTESDELLCSHCGSELQRNPAETSSKSKSANSDYQNHLVNRLDLGPGIGNAHFGGNIKVSRSEYIKVCIAGFITFIILATGYAIYHLVIK